MRLRLPFRRGTAGRGFGWNPWSLRKKLLYANFKGAMLSRAAEGKLRCPDCAMNFLYKDLFPATSQPSSAPPAGRGGAKKPSASLPASQD